jgi:glycosyltransferase involved in cell wall biosynthesis
VPEVIDDGIDGILVSPVSPLTLSAALKDLLGSGSLRARMVNAGRKKILEKFNHGAFVKRLGVLLSD